VSEYDIQRLSFGDSGWELEEDRDGSYCYFEDHRSIVATLRSENDSLRAADQHGVYAASCGIMGHYVIGKREPCPYCEAERLRAHATRMQERYESVRAVLTVWTHDLHDAAQRANTGLRTVATHYPDPR
jgi:hypothetical protein